MWCTIAAAASDRAGDLGGATLLSSQRSHHRQTDLIKNRATHTISLHTASHFHPAENTWTDLRSTSRAVARLFPSLWFGDWAVTALAAPSTLIWWWLQPTWVRRATDAAVRATTEEKQESSMHSGRVSWCWCAGDHQIIIQHKIEERNIEHSQIPEN